MAIQNRGNDGFSTRAFDRFERKAVRDAFADEKAQIEAQDKALTDAFNKLYGANISYGTDGYDQANAASPTPYTKPTSQDKALTKVLNETFGGHVSFATDHHNMGKEDHKLNDALNQMSGVDLGFSTTDSGSDADPAASDKALTDMMNGMFGTNVGYASTSASAPSSDELKAQDESLTETINRLLGTDLK